MIQDILTALNGVSSRLSTIEQKIDRTEEQLQDRSFQRDMRGTTVDSLGAVASQQDDSDAEENGGGKIGLAYDQ